VCTLPVECSVANPGCANEILIEPAPQLWRGLVSSGRADAGRFAEAARSFRSEIGLEADGPVIMSGHQAGFWHPGIVAKYAAVQGAEVFGTSAWLVADLDTNEPTQVRVPRRDGDSVVRVEVVKLAGEGAGHPDAPTGLRPAVSVAGDLPQELKTVGKALSSDRAGASSLAGQVHGAAADLLEEAGAGRPGEVVYASAISRTGLFSAVLEEMVRDPERCVLTYNAAVAACPDAGVRKLLVDEDRGRWELPVWVLGFNEPRKAAIVEKGQMLDASAHGPRGLLMTGLMRLAGCDLFIHGTGGGVYDTITERWLRDWLGVTLAPAAVVSATLRLDLGFGALTPEDAQALIALGHRARHDPELLDDRDNAKAKRVLVDQIHALERGDPARRDLFMRMHAVLDQARKSGRDRLDGIDKQVEQARAVLRSREAVLDRTWSFVLHEDAAIERLCGCVHRAMAGEATPSRGSHRG
jgi:hypothetical protein